VAASSGAEDVDNSPAAYNQSIYLMVAVPYASLGVFGFLIYRGYKKNELYRNRLHGTPGAADNAAAPGDPLA
jgi:hypothetical protein